LPGTSVNRQTMESLTLRTHFPVSAKYTARMPSPWIPSERASPPAKAFGLAAYVDGTNLANTLA
jgi:hypothetical protein